MEIALGGKLGFALEDPFLCRFAVDMHATMMKPYTFFADL